MITVFYSHVANSVHVSEVVYRADVNCRCLTSAKKCALFAGDGTSRARISNRGIIDEVWERLVACRYSWA